MEPQKKPIGLVIKELSEEKGFKVKTLSQLKGITPQAVHDVFKRSSIGTNELDEWATILEVSPGYILEKTKVKEEGIKVKDEISFGGDSYLMRRLADLEEMVHFLKGQVSEKDSMIRFLQGKSGSVPLARFAALPLFFCG
ncbi:helix-turn-helix domain-containing protein [Runella limosa]|uniref:helix-turn-helix domain-containing protein n=1 Tax=Runella limosa TaxID=370978 RepID=UPI0003F5CDF1|nr:helix-turn-helix domain-containing protein [Runella limosa]